MDNINSEWAHLLYPIERLQKDIIAANELTSFAEANYMVKTFYTMQELRKASVMQEKELRKATKPCNVAPYMTAQYKTLETSLKLGIEKFASEQPIGQWMLRLYGIGPILSANMLSHIDINRINNYGHLVAYAGMTATPPTWGKGMKRPFNADFKTAVWKVGDTMMKFSSHPKCVHGHYYLHHKAREWRRNLNGELTQYAAEQLTRKTYDKNTDAYFWYSGQVSAEAAAEYHRRLNLEGAHDVKGRIDFILEQMGEDKITQAEIAELQIELDLLKGNEPDIKAIMADTGGTGVPMLPPAHLVSRAKRKVGVLFLSHLYEVWAGIEKGQSIDPYPMAQMGHEDYIPPPYYDRANLKVSNKLWPDGIERVIYAFPKTREAIE